MEIGEELPSVSPQPLARILVGLLEAPVCRRSDELPSSSGGSHAP